MTSSPRTRPALRFFAEGFLWLLTHCIAVAGAAGAAWLCGKYFLGFGYARNLTWTALVSASALTWGSWASLIWSRSRFWRVMEQVVTFLPGLVMVLLGGLAAYVTAFSKPLIYMPLMAGGIGSMALAYVFAGGFLIQNQAPNRAQFLFGLVLFPLLTGIVSLLAWLGWISFLSASALNTCRDMFLNPGALAAKYFTLSILFALTSTVFPAGISRLCRDAQSRLAQMR